MGEVGPSMNSGFGDRVLERTGDLGGWDTVVGEGMFETDVVAVAGMLLRRGVWCDCGTRAVGTG